MGIQKEMHRLIIDFKKFYDSGRKEVLYNILIESVIPMYLVRLTKMCVNETCNSEGRQTSDMFLVKNGSKKDALSPLLFNFVLQQAVGRVQINQEGLKLNGTRQIIIYTVDVNIFGRKRNILKRILLAQYCSGDQMEKNEMGGTCSLYEEEERCAQVLVGKPEGKRPLRRSWFRLEDNFKMDLQVVRGEHGLD